MLSGRHMQHKRVHDKIEPVASGICHYAWQILHHSHSIRSWYPLAANFCIIVMPYAHGTPVQPGVPGQPSIKLSFSFNQCEKVIVVSFLSARGTSKGLVCSERALQQEGTGVEQPALHYDGACEASSKQRHKSTAGLQQRCHSCPCHRACCAS